MASYILLMALLSNADTVSVYFEEEVRALGADALPLHLGHVALLLLAPEDEGVKLPIRVKHVDFHSSLGSSMYTFEQFATLWLL